MGEWVRRYIGIPFRYEGRDHAGVDCYGLIWLVLKEQFGITLQDWTGYGKDPKRSLLLDMYMKGLGSDDWRRVYAPKLGSAVLLRFGGLALHCGLMINERQMIHALWPNGVVMENLNGITWRHKVVAYYDHCKFEKTNP